MLYEVITDALGEFKDMSTKLHSKYTLTHDQISAIDRMDDLTDQIQSPLQNLENKLHGWVAFVIMPIFAFANAGVKINDESFANVDLSFIIAASLILGNVIGISLLSFLAIKLKLASLPENTSLKQLAITGVITSYSIHYTKLYDGITGNSFCLWCWGCTIFLSVNLPNAELLIALQTAQLKAMETH